MMCVLQRQESQHLYDKFFPARGCLALLVMLLPFMSMRVVLAAAFGQYDDNVSVNIRQIPFSRYGSYLTFQHVKGSARIIPPEGLFLRSARGGLVDREMFRVEVLDR